MSPKGHGHACFGRLLPGSKNGPSKLPVLGQHPEHDPRKDITCTFKKESYQGEGRKKRISKTAPQKMSQPVSLACAQDDITSVLVQLRLKRGRRRVDALNSPGRIRPNCINGSGSEQVFVGWPCPRIFFQKNRRKRTTQASVPGFVPQKNQAFQHIPTNQSPFFSPCDFM